MGISIGGADIACAYLGGTPVSEIYVGDVKVRPINKTPFVDFLLIGGGGGGGMGYGYTAPGGGGGGGGFVECTNYELCAGTYSIKVGAGGTGGENASGQDGGCSEFNGIIAYGGGGGGMANCRGCPGGSGGGGGKATGRCAGGTGVTGQGNRGGCGHRYSGGGGGGAGTAGADTCHCYCGANGGDGKCSCISGDCIRYSGGGGGGGCNSSTDARHGAGGQGSGCGRLGCYCYGGGGGGGQTNATKGGVADSGMPGIFILSYPAACKYNICGGCEYTCNNHKIHCFTSNGTLTVG